MKFFVVIGKNGLHTFERNGQEFKAQYIEGSAEFSVKSSNVAEDVTAYLKNLSNEKNLGERFFDDGESSSAEKKVMFDVLESVSESRNRTILDALRPFVDKSYPLREVLRTVYRELDRDKSLLIGQYGINYDGVSFKAEGKELVQGKFDLLAYTIHGSDVVKRMGI